MKAIYAKKSNLLSISLQPPKCLSLKPIVRNNKFNRQHLRSVFHILSISFKYQLPSISLSFKMRSKEIKLKSYPITVPILERTNLRVSRDFFWSVLIFHYHSSSMFYILFMLFNFPMPTVTKIWYIAICVGRCFNRKGTSKKTVC